MNVLAGVLIGWFNDVWIARLVAPLAWGLLWCGYKSILGEAQEHAAKMIARGVEAPQGGHVLAFYKIEYLTATTTAFLFSVAAGGVKALFS